MGTPKKRVAWALGYISLISASVVFLVIGDYSEFSLPSLGWAVVAALCGAILMRFFLALAWLLLLRSHSGQRRISRLKSLVVFVDAWWGRYVPGRVASVLVRIAAARRLGVSRISMFSSSVTEASLNFTVQGALAATLVGNLGFGANKVEVSWALLTAALFVSVVISTPGNLTRLLRFAARLRPNIHAESIRAGTFGSNFSAVLIYFAAALLNGLVLWFLVLAYQPEGWEKDNLWLGVGAAAAVSVASFLIVIVPGGLLVAEASLTLLLSALGLDLQTAIKIAILWRLVSITADLFFWLIARGSAFLKSVFGKSE